MLGSMFSLFFWILLWLIRLYSYAVFFLSVWLAIAGFVCMIYHAFTFKPAMVLGSGMTGRWERSVAFLLFCIVPGILLLYFSLLSLSFASSQLNSLYPPLVEVVAAAPTTSWGTLGHAGPNLDVDHLPIV